MKPISILISAVLVFVLGAFFSPLAGAMGTSVAAQPEALLITATPVPQTPSKEDVATAAPLLGKITVSGQAEVRVVPDEVVVTLGVETNDLSLAVARAQNDEIVAKVLQAAEAVGVAAKDVQTEFIQIEPRYNSDYEKRNFLGYYARKTIAITLRDLERFEELLTGCFEAGVNYVHGVEFRTSELRKYRDEAREMALQAAQEKAIDMTAALGRTAGAALEVTENSTGWWSGYSSWWGGGWSSMMQNSVQNAGNAAAEISGMAPGAISVTASVTVVFEMR
ncbi:MAG: SIMPL domain-containing protein [Anaerolineaceae bacterium]|nr:SIMPL domain-containing protein [Anaerolineaceae bacterium]